VTLGLAARYPCAASGTNAARADDAQIVAARVILRARLPSDLARLHVCSMRHPPQRRFPERPEAPIAGRPKDTISAERLYKLRAGLYAIAGGVVMGMVLGWRFGTVIGMIGIPLGWTIAYVLILGLLEGAARTAQTVYAPSGASTPARREYSRAQALRAAGEYPEAVAAYEAFATEFPEEPEPYLQIAWILRDDLAAYGDAARWLRRARSEARLTLGQQLMVAQELIELYRHKLDEPQRAMPELARIADLVPGTPQATSAKLELAELRASTWGNESDAKQ
jgi:tetratricopeptide (TPR) repeat protein